MNIQLTHNFNDIISLENILQAWTEFLKEKGYRKDVQQFKLHLMDNIFALHFDLANLTYKHGEYQAFNISDPKPRNIHKATVRDRLLHHAIYQILYPFFERTFIPDSYSCRDGKGTHRAVQKFRSYLFKASKNYTRSCWILKCDIKKFFANIDHDILRNLLKKYIPDKKILWLLGRVIDSFSTKPGVGLPLGNLTSQLLVNVYMNELDQFMKHKLLAKYYLRYADDFAIISEDKILLQNLIPKIAELLGQKLRLSLHPDKVSIRTIGSGVDFLGWVNFPDHKVLRTTTKRRMFKKMKESLTSEATLQSYLGLLSHGNTNKMKNSLLKIASASFAKENTLDSQSQNCDQPSEG